jgi:hypothetical protein
MHKRQLLTDGKKPNFKPGQQQEHECNKENSRQLSAAFL